MTNCGDVPCFPMFSLFFGQLLHTTLTNVAVVIISMSDLHQMSIDSLELQQKCLHTVTFSSDTLFKLAHSPSISYLFYLPDLPTFALHALCFHFHNYSIYSLGTLIAALTRIFNWEQFPEWQGQVCAQWTLLLCNLLCEFQFFPHTWDCCCQPHQRRKHKSNAIVRKPRIETGPRQTGYCVSPCTASKQQLHIKLASNSVTFVFHFLSKRLSLLNRLFIRAHLPPYTL